MASHTAGTEGGFAEVDVRLGDSAIKALLTFGFLCSAAATLLFWQTTLKASALSVYTVQPTGWVLVGVVLLIGTAALLWSPHDRLRFASILLIVFGIALSVGAPYLMGVSQSQASDPLVHTLFIEHLNHRGEVTVLRYLSLHIPISALSSITGVSIPILVAWFPALSKAFGLVAIVYFVSAFDFVPDDRRWLAAAWAAPFVGGLFEVSFYPENMAIHFGFLVMGIALRYEKTPSAAYGIALFLGAVGILMMHPRMSAYIFGFIVVLYLVRSKLDIRGKHVAVVFTLAVLWGYWSTLLEPTGGIVSRLASLFGGTTATFSGNVGRAATIGTAGLVRFAVTNFAPIFLLGVAAFFGFVLLFVQPRFSPAKRPMLAGILVGVLGLGSPIFIGRQALSRAVQASLFLLILPVLAFIGLHLAKNRRVLAIVFLAAILATSTVTIHRSPFTLQTSWHVDDPGVTFGAWMEEHVEGLYLTAGVHSELVRFGQAASKNLEEDTGRLTLTDASGTYLRDAGVKQWLSEGEGIVLHSRIQARCRHPTLQHEIIEGKPFLHRDDYCLLDEEHMGTLADIVFDSGDVILARRAF